MDKFDLKAARSALIAGDKQKALEICLKLLTANWSDHRTRLMLARVFFELEMYDFAAREVAELVKSFPQSETLQSLLKKLDPARRFLEQDGKKATVPNASDQTESEQVIAEADFDLELLEGLEDE